MFVFDRRARAAALAALLLSTGAALAQQPMGVQEPTARPSFEAPSPAPSEMARPESNMGNPSAPASEARSEPPANSSDATTGPSEQRVAPTFNSGPPKLTAKETEAALESRARAEKMDNQNVEGIGDDASIVKPILARHPESNLIICVAGCGPEPSIVQVLPREVETRTESKVIPSSGELGAASKDVAPREANEVDIVCLAGCLKKRGEVVHRRGKVSWLSPEEVERMAPLLRRVAQRLGGNLAVASADDAAEWQAFDAWSRMGRALVDAGITVAEQSGE